MTTLALDPEQIESFEDGKLHPITEATDSAVLEPPADSTSYGICINGTPDSSPVSSSEPCEPVDTELDRLSIFKFNAIDVFQHSPTGDVLNSLKKPIPGRRPVAELCSVRTFGGRWRILFPTRHPLRSHH